MPFNLRHNLVKLSSFIFECNDDISIVHFLINYVFSPLTSPLFVIFGSIIESSTHIVHCVWAFSFLFVYSLQFSKNVVKLSTQNGHLFAYYYPKHNGIVYKDCALCLGKTIFLCLCKSLHLKK
jgi:hypothetical protein